MKIKFWQRPSYEHKMFMFGCIIAGSLGTLVGIYFKDKNTIILSCGVILMGIIVGGFQSIAWKQWEDKRQKKK